MIQLEARFICTKLHSGLQAKHHIAIFASTETWISQPFVRLYVGKQISITSSADSAAKIAIFLAFATTFQAKPHFTVRSTFGQAQLVCCWACQNACNFASFQYFCVCVHWLSACFLGLIWSLFCLSYRSHTQALIVFSVLLSVCPLQRDTRICWSYPFHYKFVVSRLFSQ